LKKKKQQKRDWAMLVGGGAVFEGAAVSSGGGPDHLTIRQRRGGTQGDKREMGSTRESVGLIDKEPKQKRKFGKTPRIRKKLQRS